MCMTSCCDTLPHSRLTSYCYSNFNNRETGGQGPSQLEGQLGLVLKASWVLGLWASPVVISTKISSLSTYLGGGGKGQLQHSQHLVMCSAGLVHGHCGPVGGGHTGDASYARAYAVGSLETMMSEPSPCFSIHWALGKGTVTDVLKAWREHLKSGLEWTPVSGYSAFCIALRMAGSPQLDHCQR